MDRIGYQLIKKKTLILRGDEHGVRDNLINVKAMAKPEIVSLEIIVS